MKLPKKQSLQMSQQQSHEKDESVLDEVQKEEEVQPAEWINQPASDETVGQLTVVMVAAEVAEERVQLESYDHQDSALHAYYAHADVQHAGCHEKTWERGRGKNRRDASLEPRKIPRAASSHSKHREARKKSPKTYLYQQN